MRHASCPPTGSCIRTARQCNVRQIVHWLSGISVTCFAASYALVWLLELTRILFRVPLRQILILGMTLAGLFAHTVYLAIRISDLWNQSGMALGSWSVWCLVAAWTLVLGYIWTAIRQPKTMAGLFLFPLVLTLIVAAVGQSHGDILFASSARTIWNWIHGLALLFGTATAGLGFVFGSMYLVQSSRLKRKLPVSRTFRHPSLEWLHRATEWMLFSSLLLIGGGLLSGLALNEMRRRSGLGRLPFDDPVVWTSAVLFAWLAVVLIFYLVYRPAREGRKVAYLVVASFVFLWMELLVVWNQGHGTPAQQGTPARINGSPDTSQSMEDRP